MPTMPMRVLMPASAQADRAAGGMAVGARADARARRMHRPPRLVAAVAAPRRDGRAEQRPGEHVGGIVHAEVQARVGQPRRERVQRRRRQPDARIRKRPGERRRGVRAGKAQRRRRADQRRQAGQLRPAAAHDQLDRRVQHVHARHRSGRPPPAPPPRRIDRLPSHPDRQPHPRVLAKQRKPPHRPLQRRRMPSGPRHAQSCSSRHYTPPNGSMSKRDADAVSEMCCRSRIGA